MKGKGQPQNAQGHDAPLFPKARTLFCDRELKLSLQLGFPNLGQGIGIIVLARPHIGLSHGQEFLTVEFQGGGTVALAELNVGDNPCLALFIDKILQTLGDDIGPLLGGQAGDAADRNHGGAVE